MAPAGLTAFGGVTHTLHPGDVACGARGDRLVTLLGSCVAVVLTDPRRTVGAMCHIVHARRADRDEAPDRDSTWGDVALDVMYELLRERGISPRLCEAYVYGGGNMFPGHVREGHVGASNADWTLQALATDGVRVLHQDLGGATYRKLSWTVGPEAPQVTAVPVWAEEGLP
jgi:chemotaxis protein CheD